MTEKSTNLLLHAKFLDHYNRFLLNHISSVPPNRALELDEMAL